MKRKNLLFWIKSSRGTDERTIVSVPISLSDNDIRIELEDWCSRFTAWTASENVVDYEYKSISVPKSKKRLNKMWSDICKKRSDINDKWKNMLCMFDIRKIK